MSFLEGKMMNLEFVLYGVLSHVNFLVIHIVDTVKYINKSLICHDGEKSKMCDCRRFLRHLHKLFLPQNGDKVF